MNVDRQTDRLTHGPNTVTLAAQACRGLKTQNSEGKLSQSQYTIMYIHECVLLDEDSEDTGPPATTII